MTEAITSLEIDSLDRQILQCLQIWPRASWVAISKVLDADPITIARRWDKLSSHGYATISTYPSTRNRVKGQVGALIELKVLPQHIHTATKSLIELPMIGTIRTMISDWNISMDTTVLDMSQLEELLTTRLGEIEGVVSYRSSLVGDVLADGARWRINELPMSAIHKFEAQAQESLANASDEPAIHAIDHKIIQAMFTNPRMGIQELATSLEISINTARKHLGHLIKGGHLTIRCDIARRVSGWPITVRYLGSLPLQKYQEIGERAKKINEIRSMLLLVGPNNVMLNVWLKEYSDISKFEAYLATVLPDITIQDRSVVSSFKKLMWKPVDANGLFMNH